MSLSSRSIIYAALFPFVFIYGLSWLHWYVPDSGRLRSNNQENLFHIRNDLGVELLMNFLIALPSIQHLTVTTAWDEPRVLTYRGRQASLHYESLPGSYFPHSVPSSFF